ncbi:MAG TPA: hypothetical protein EYN93_10365 [Planctomycetaceae bacterium]|nr:hypothetical protein [Planctomycetaceae bacterium]
MSAARLFAVCCLIIAPSAISAQSNFHDLLPESTAAVLQIQEPGEILQQFLTHPVINSVYDAGLYDELIDDAQRAQIETLQNIIQDITGLPWEDAIKQASSGGVHLAFDPSSEGVLLVLRGDEVVLDKVFDAVLSWLQPLAALSGNPLKKGEYREGIIGYQIQEIRFAKKAGTLVVTNSRDLGRFVLDQLIDPTTHPTFASNKNYQAATVNSKPQQHTAWLWADAKLLQQNNGLEQLEQAMRQNMLLELLAGGLVNQLAKSPYITAAIDFDHQHLKLDLTTAHDAEWIPESRQYYFGADANGSAPSLLLPTDTIASISMFRDFSPWWLLAPDLYDDDVNEGIAQADTTLSQFFSGKDFGLDILGALEPGAQLVVTDNQFADDAPQPDIIFPAFAIVGTLENSETMQAELRRIFINFAGFLNVISAMEGNPQLDIELVDSKKDRIITTSFIPPLAGQPISVQYNFSPTILFKDDKLILSSTRLLAEKLRDGNQEAESAKRNSNRGNWTTNTHLTLLAGPLASILRKNREILITNNMLENSSDREEAETQIDLLISMVQLTNALDITIKSTSKQLALSFELKFQPDSK